MGQIHYRCRLSPYPVDGDWIADKNDTRVCGSFHQCNPERFCGSLFETYL